MTPNELQTYIDNHIEARMEEIAQRAADKAIEKVYAQVGRGFLTKFAWLVGAALLSLLAWMAGRGIKLTSP
jgi:predicted Co/Zn/Cd cation transporter (cation efflux family)